MLFKNTSPLSLQHFKEKGDCHMSALIWGPTNHCMVCLQSGLPVPACFRVNAWRLGLSRNVTEMCLCERWSRMTSRQPTGMSSLVWKTLTLLNQQFLTVKKRKTHTHTHTDGESDFIPPFVHITHFPFYRTFVLQHDSQRGLTALSSRVK